MLISPEDRSDKGVFHARKWLFGASGMTLPLYKRDRGVPGRKPETLPARRLRTLKDRIPITGLMVEA